MRYMSPELLEPIISRYSIKDFFLQNPSDQAIFVHHQNSNAERKINACQLDFSAISIMIVSMGLMKLDAVSMGLSFLISNLY